MQKRLAVLASGTGSLLEAMIDEKLPIALVLIDRPCRAHGVAVEAGIKTMLLQRTFGSTFDRDAYTRQVTRVLHDENIDLVAMAGFMTVFAPCMFDEGGYAGRLINTHPSLLPAFKGAHAVRDALEYGVKVTGCTIHHATRNLDEGKIIAQEVVKVFSGDTIATLHERIKDVERRQYPWILRALISTN